MTKPEQFNKAFEMILLLAKMRAEKATGATQEDYKYGVAESVRAAMTPGYVYVTRNGKEYGPVMATWGPLDGDKEKMTALVNARGEDDTQDLWIKLEYKDTEVKPFKPNK